MADPAFWQIDGTLDGVTVHASWTDDGGLAASPALYEACWDLESARAVVSATPTGPTWTASLGAADAAWATVRAALDEVTAEAGLPPGYPWDVPPDAIC